MVIRPCFFRDEVYEISLAVPKIKMLEDLFEDFFILYETYHTHFIRALMARNLENLGPPKSEGLFG